MRRAIDNMTIREIRGEIRKRGCVVYFGTASCHVVRESQGGLHATVRGEHGSQRREDGDEDVDDATECLA